MAFPDCPINTLDKCVFEESGASSTLMYFPPRYDRTGKNLNPDRNTTTVDVKCLTCGASWVSTRVGTDPAQFKLIRSPEGA